FSSEENSNDPSIVTISAPSPARGPDQDSLPADDRDHLDPVDGQGRLDQGDGRDHLDPVVDRDRRDPVGDQDLRMAVALDRLSQAPLPAAGSSWDARPTSSGSSLRAPSGTWACRDAHRWPARRARSLPARLAG